MPYKDPEVRRQKAKERQKKYREKNKEKLAQKNLLRYHAIYKHDEESAQRHREYRKEWALKNDYKYELNEEQKGKARDRARQWQKDHPEQARSNNRLRKRRVRQAMPEWVDRKALAEVYRLAIELEEKTGEKYHVDHIIPLVNDKVCGLHVPWNLQVIPAKENIKKGNSFDN